MTAWYSWAFDGVAGAAFVAISIAIYERHASKRDRIKGITIFSAEKWLPAADGSSAGQSQGLGITEPSPSKILAEVDNSLPFDRHTAKLKYVDLPVVWKTLLSDFSYTDGGVMVHTRHKSDDGGSALVAFVASSLPGNLKTATVGSELLIRGRIHRVWELGVYLADDPEVTLLKRA